MRSVISFLMLLTFSLNAYQGFFSASADLLYWQPVFSPYDLPGPGANVANPQRIKGKAAFGTRVTVGYHPSCFSTQLSYLWFESYQQPKVGSFLGLPPPIFATYLSVGFRYQNIDGRFAYQLPVCKPATFGLFANARWVNTSQNVHFDYRSNGEDQKRTVGRNCFSLQGGALGLGINGDAPLFCHFHLVGLLNPMVVLGHQNPGSLVVHDISTGGVFANVTRSPSRFSLFPALDLQLALKYVWNSPFLKIAWSVGYELNYYWHDYVFIPIENNACRDLGFAGPFLRGVLCF